MDAPENKPFAKRLQEKLAASRFFTFSMLLHVILVVMGGSVVLFKAYVEPPDFVAQGGVVSGEVSAQPPPEQPPDMTQQTFTPEQPTISAPSVSAITSTTTAPTTFQMASIPVPVKAIGEIKTAEMPKAVGSAMGKGLPSTMAGRAGGTARTQAMMKSGGKEKSEKAVMQGLRWLKQNQNPDGSWAPSNKGGMTGLAILCFLGHGETAESPEFGPTVKKALDWALTNGTKFQGKMHMGNSFTQPGVYEHPMLTYALGEYYTMTKDDRFAELLRQAITYIVEGQAPDGGWQYNYTKGPDSDTSVAGWQIQALKAAHLSGLNISGVDEALDKAMLNLERVQSENGNFGYRKKGDRGNNPSLAGVGVLCTYFWKQDKSKVVKEGIDFILKQCSDDFPVKYKGNHADLYAWYYHTQACLMYGGSAWSKWNRMFQDEIADAQSPDGSWPPTGNPKPHGPEAQPNLLGQVYRTALCVLMLEVFYRYMPTTK